MPIDVELREGAQEKILIRREADPLLFLFCKTYSLLGASKDAKVSKALYLIAGLSLLLLLLLLLLTISRTRTRTMGRSLLESNHRSDTF
jgi:hypothetical protein